MATVVSPHWIVGVGLGSGRLCVTGSVRSILSYSLSAFSAFSAVSLPRFT